MEQVVNNQTVFEDRFSWEAVVIYNQLNVTRETLADQIEEAGFQHVSAPAEIGQLGQEIVIPPKVIG